MEQYSRSKLKKFLEEKIRPKIQGDGGEFEIISIENNILTLALTGDCSRCPITNLCYEKWLEEILKKEFCSKIKIMTKKKKPYFWA